MTSGRSEHVLEAYGGLAGWQAANVLESRFSTRGWGFRLRLQPPDEHIQVEASLGGLPMARYRPADRDGHAFVAAVMNPFPQGAPV